MVSESGDGQPEKELPKPDPPGQGQGGGVIDLGDVTSDKTDPKTEDQNPPEIEDSLDIRELEGPLDNIKKNASIVDDRSKTMAAWNAELEAEVDKLKKDLFLRDQMVEKLSTRVKEVNKILSDMVDRNQVRPTRAE